MTSKLEKYLSTALYTRFGQYSIRQNYHADWLMGLELDFYIDELKLAAEVQGEQHYRFIKHFHKTEKGFEDQKIRDAQKRMYCRERHVELVEIFTETDANLFIEMVRERGNIPVSAHKWNEKELKKSIKSYQTCVRKLFLFETGTLKATEAQVGNWKKVIREANQ